MSKSKILAELDAMVSARLFGSGPWLSDPESGVALQRRLEQMGLEERVPSASDTWRNTPLGRELHLHLLMVFMGLWDEREIPMILEDHGFIDDLGRHFLRRSDSATYITERTVAALRNILAEAAGPLSTGAPISTIAVQSPSPRPDCRVRRPKRGPRHLA